MSDHSSVAITSENITERLANALTRARLDWYDEERLEELTGIKARTIRSYRCESKEPSLSTALKLWFVLGPKYSDPVLKLLGCRLVLIEEHDMRQDMARITSEGLEAFAVIAKAAADGRIDHTELPGVQDACDQLIRLLLPLAKMGQGK